MHAYILVQRGPVHAARPVGRCPDVPVREPLSSDMYVYVCTYIYIYIYMYIAICIYIYIYTHSRLRLPDSRPRCPSPRLLVVMI